MRNKLIALAAWPLRITVSLARFIVQFVLYLYERCQDLVEWINFRVEALFLEPEYVKTGQCNMTGQCCKAIGIEFPRSWVDKPHILQWLQRWHSLRYNFQRVGLDDNLLIYECRYLRNDKRCGIQHFKPKLCRDFPHRPWRGKIRLHKGCGYRYVPRSTHEFKRRLHRDTPANGRTLGNNKNQHAVSLQSLRSELPSHHNK